MKNETQGNKVEFILDGHRFFAELASQLARVRDAEPAPDTYVRMAFWAARSICTIDFKSVPRKNLKAVLHEVADKGHQVQFICWRPGLVARVRTRQQSASLATTQKAMSEAFHGSESDDVPAVTDIDQLKKDLDYRSAVDVADSKGVKHRGRVQVYMETYDGWFFGNSTHQKIAIFSVAGELTVIIGGINLLSSYWATQSHSVLDKNGKAVCFPWHDTAVKIQGPATLAVEQEWLRRWNKQLSWLASRPPQAEANKQPIAKGGSDVAILTTNSESLKREIDIRAAMRAKIAGAKHYVYLENYVLSDPGIVSALAEQLRKEKDLLVVFVTGKDDDLYKYMTRISLLKLVIAAGGDGSIEVPYKGGLRAGSFDKDFPEGRVIEGDFSVPDRINALALHDNPFMAKDQFEYKDPADKRPVRVFLGEVVRASSSRVRFCYPIHPDLTDSESLYVHSKLVLIDDEVAFVGSANLSYRSMVYDGEICACISGDAAKQIRVELFQHYGLEFSDAKHIQEKFYVTVATPTDPNKTHLKNYSAAAMPTQHPTTGEGNHTWH